MGAFPESCDFQHKWVVWHLEWAPHPDLHAVLHVQPQQPGGGEARREALRGAERTLYLPASEVTFLTFHFNVCVCVHACMCTASYTWKRRILIVTVLATWACLVQDRALSVEWSCEELHLWNGAMGSSVEWSYVERHQWSGAMWSSICEVELWGAPSVEWNYGELCGVELWGVPSVKWSYRELHLWGGTMWSSVSEVELWEALWSGAMGSSICVVELWGALVLEVINGGEFDKKVFGLASLLCSHRISIWRMVSWFYGILVS